MGRGLALYRLQQQQQQAPPVGPAPPAAAAGLPRGVPRQVGGRPAVQTVNEDDDSFMSSASANSRASRASRASLQPLYRL